MLLETQHDGTSKTWPEGQCEFSPFTPVKESIDFLNSGSTIHLHSPLQISDQETEHMNHIPKLMDRTVGSSLSVEKSNDVLISANGIFSAGFYQVGNNTFCFAIWFTKSWGATTVWMANHDQPVNGRGSKLSLLRNGNLILTDGVPVRRIPENIRLESDFSVEEQISIGTLSSGEE
ncbi:putative receptor protein kinase ZmPK1 [Vitis vinifera]|uniref:Putative receptor protein kinase ZmPK1 n=1 Tax=Vitis vinifera TaxID=29760 RepID=A0A438DYB8_VITVI|nr:putative receptor protein kinase ZmPK1 [Vitis vinifera]